MRRDGIAATISSKRCDICRLFINDFLTRLNSTNHKLSTRLAHNNRYPIFVESLTKHRDSINRPRVERHCNALNY